MISISNHLTKAHSLWPTIKQPLIYIFKRMLYIWGNRNHLPKIYFWLFSFNLWILLLMSYFDLFFSSFVTKSLLKLLLVELSLHISFSVRFLLRTRVCLLSRTVKSFCFNFHPQVVCGVRLWKDGGGEGGREGGCDWNAQHANSVVIEASRSEPDKSSVP